MYKYFCSLLMLLSACTTPSQDKLASSQDAYFDMPSLVQQQLDLLSNEHASVIKRKEVNSKVQEIAPDSINWAKELTLFKNANINKPVLKGTYEVKKEDNKAELITSYHSINEKNKVKKLKVSKEMGQVTAIYIEWEDSNPIYHSEKMLSMTFEKGKLQTYGIHGYQKMVADDTLFYKPDAEVKYP